MDSRGPVKLQAIDKQTRAAMVETMATPISRRRFVESALLASAAVPLTLNAQGDSSPATTALGGAAAASKEALPHGKIGHQEFSRLMMGGNLIAGCSHSRDLNYVSAQMPHYKHLCAGRQPTDFRSLEVRRQNEVGHPGANGRRRRLLTNPEGD